MVHGQTLEARDITGLHAAHNRRDVGAWVKAGNLQPGDRIESQRGSQEVLAVRTRQTREWVYNFEVAGVHTYSVSGAGLVVHNSCGHAAIDALDKNKQHHILQGKHNWKDVAKDPSSWDEVSKVMADVMNNGTESAYKTVHKKQMTVNGKEVVVTYKKNTDGTVSVSDAWVEPQGFHHRKGLGMDIEGIRNNVRSGRLDRAAEALRTMPSSQLDQTLAALCTGGDDSLGVAVYGLAVDMLQRETETAGFHISIVSLLVNDLVWLTGAYPLALHHARRALLLSPNDIELMEQVLFFDCVPDPPLPADEARVLAEQVLAISPTSVIAADVLRRARKS